MNLLILTIHKVHIQNVFLAVMCYILSALLNRIMDTETHLTDGRGVKFFLVFPLLQRQNSLNLKEPQTLFGCLWFETTTT